MDLLISELIDFYKTDKCLKNFLPQFKHIFDYTKIMLKKELLYGTYNKDLLYRNNDFEIVFITWGINAESCIHSHPENGCILTILDGDLIEERYNNNGELFEYNFLKMGNIGYMENKIGKHRIINKNDFNVYSLHIYSPSNFYNKG